MPRHTRSRKFYRKLRQDYPGQYPPAYPNSVPYFQSQQYPYQYQQPYYQESYPPQQFVAQTPPVGVQQQAQPQVPLDFPPPPPPEETVLEREETTGEKVASELHEILSKTNLENHEPGQIGEKSDIIENLFVLQNVSEDEARSFCDIFETGAKMTMKEAGLDKSKLRVTCSIFPDKREFDQSRRFNVFYGVTKPEIIEKLIRDTKENKEGK